MRTRQLSLISTAAIAAGLAASLTGCGSSTSVSTTAATAPAQSNAPAQSTAASGGSAPATTPVGAPTTAAPTATPALPPGTLAIPEFGMQMHIPKGLSYVSYTVSGHPGPFTTGVNTRGTIDFTTPEFAAALKKAGDPPSPLLSISITDGAATEQGGPAYSSLKVCSGTWIIRGGGDGAGPLAGQPQSVQDVYLGQIGPVNTMIDSAICTK